MPVSPILRRYVSPVALKFMICLEVPEGPKTEPTFVATLVPAAL